MSGDPVKALDYAGRQVGPGGRSAWSDRVAIIGCASVDDHGLRISADYL